MSEIDEILKQLEYIQQQKRPVSIVNTYQGVSLSLEVEIDQILWKRANVVVVAQTGRQISLLPATEIQIHSDLFPRPIQARVASLDVHRRTAILQNFTYIKSKNDGRKENRVQPKHEMKATVIIGGKNERTGKINDISIEGISLILKSNNVDLTNEYPPNTSVRITYNLPVATDNEPEKISVPAKVTYINEINSMEEFILGFMTYPKEDQREVLRRFIYDRQTEMFHDLSQDSTPSKSSSIIF